MPEQLLEIRRESYQAAITFHRALAEIAGILVTKETAALLYLERFDRAAIKYEQALLLLLAHLQTLPRTEFVDAEISSIDRLLAEIHRECASVIEDFGTLTGHFSGDAT